MPGTGLRLVPVALQSSCLGPLVLYQVVNAWMGTYVYLLWTTGLCFKGGCGSAAVDIVCGGSLIIKLGRELSLRESSTGARREEP